MNVICHVCKRTHETEIFPRVGQRFFYKKAMVIIEDNAEELRRDHPHYPDFIHQLLGKAGIGLSLLVPTNLDVTNNFEI